MAEFIKSLAIAGATTLGAWLVTRWRESRRAAAAATPRRSVQTWEDEGGALAPQPDTTETSQVPR